MCLSGCCRDIERHAWAVQDLGQVNNSRLVTQVGNANERARAATHVHSFGHTLSNFSTFRTQENNDLSWETCPDIMAMVKYCLGLLAFWITWGGD